VAVWRNLAAIFLSLSGRVFFGSLPEPNAPVKQLPTKSGKEGFGRKTGNTEISTSEHGKNYNTREFSKPSKDYL